MSLRSAKKYKRFLVVAACILVTVLIRYEMTKMPDAAPGLDVHINSNQYQNEEDEGTDDPMLVIIMAYQRTGSTFTGQIFNHNDEATYMFEPVDGIYSALYGTQQGYNMPSDITTFSNGSLRVLPEDENRVVADSISRMLRCDFRHLPTDVLTHKFWNPRDGLQKAFDPYISCVRNVKKGNCRSNIESICPRKVGEMGVFQTDLCKQNLWFNATVKALGRTSNTGNQQQFASYWSCDTATRASLLHCLPQVEDPCRAAKVRTMKTVRLTMQTVQVLLRRHPTLRIIHLVRDPRAVAISRLKDSTYRSQYSGNDVVREAEVYCKTVVRDLKDMEKVNSEQIMQVIYDAFTSDALGYGSKIYAFLGQSLPKSVHTFLTQLPAHTEIAQKWTKVMSAKNMKDIETVCGDFFAKIPYSWPDAQV